jgi:rhodanese-related sulfurtransferase
MQHQYSMHTLQRTNPIWGHVDYKGFLIKFIFFLLLFLLSVAPVAGQQDETGRISVDDLKLMLELKEPVLVVDVRLQPDLMIKGAKHIPLTELENRLTEIPKETIVVIYCACPKEESSLQAVDILYDHDYNQASALKGGIKAWMDAGGAVQSKSKTKVAHHRRKF